MNKLLGNLYVGLGLSIIFTLLILAYKALLFILGIIVGILLINKGLQVMGVATMQQRVKQKVMQKMNPFKFY